MYDLQDFQANYKVRRMITIMFYSHIKKVEFILKIYLKQQIETVLTSMTKTNKKIMK